MATSVEGLSADLGEESEPGGWVGVAANPRSGLGRGRARVERLARELQRRGVGVRLAWTLSERAELVEASRVEGGCRCLVAAGGDGTVADLLNERPVVPVTTLPAGTENLFARHFGIGRSPEALAEAILAGATRLLDLGLADGRRFALMAGLGFDAEVVSRHHAARVRGGVVRTSHRAAYVEPVLRSSFSYRFPELTIEAETIDGPEILVGTTAFVFNLPRYALGLPFAPSARGDDGLLDLIVFRDPGAWRALRYLWLVLRRLHLRRPGVFHRRVSRASIRSASEVPIQLDGDPSGRLAPAGAPWVAEVSPAAVQVLVPPAFARSRAANLAIAGA